MGLTGRASTPTKPSSSPNRSEEWRMFIQRIDILSTATVDSRQSKVLSNTITAIRTVTYRRFPIMFSAALLLAYHTIPPLSPWISRVSRQELTFGCIYPVHKMLLSSECSKNLSFDICVWRLLLFADSSRGSVDWNGVRGGANMLAGIANVFGGDMVEHFFSSYGRDGMDGRSAVQYPCPLLLC